MPQQSLEYLKQWIRTSDSLAVLAIIDDGQDVNSTRLLTFDDDIAQLNNGKGTFAVTAENGARLVGTVSLAYTAGRGFSFTITSIEVALPRDSPFLPTATAASDALTAAN